MSDLTLEEVAKATVSISETLDRTLDLVDTLMGCISDLTTDPMISRETKISVGAKLSAFGAAQEFGYGDIAS